MRFCHRPPKAGCRLQSLPLPTVQFSDLLFPHQRLRKAWEAESFRLAPPVPSPPEPEAAESDQGMSHTTPVEFATCFLSFLPAIWNQCRLATPYECRNFY